jgi:hypothetical protein
VIKSSESPAPNRRPQLSIVVITRNTKDLAVNLLASIEADKSIAPFLREVILVDNASSDDTVALVGEKFPSVTLIRNASNRGFAAAANAGTYLATGEFVLFLNSDTLLIEGELVPMLEYMAENKDVGICGPQLVYGDMKLQRSFAYIPSLPLEILPASLLAFLFRHRYPAKPKVSNSKLKRPASGHPDSKLPSAMPHAPYPMLSPSDVPSLIGAAIVTRKSLLTELGGFDERFFFFLEETDLCVRAQQKGARVVFFPRARVIHLQGATVRRNWVRGRIQYNISLYKFIRKHHGALYYGLFQAVRVTKCFFLLLLFTAVPLSLLGKGIRRRYLYNLNLLLWHLRGCPDNAGLPVSSPG